MGDELVELNQRRPTSMSMNPWNHSAICAWVLEPADVSECVLASLGPWHVLVPLSMTSSVSLRTMCACA